MNRLDTIPLSVEPPLTVQDLTSLDNYSFFRDDTLLHTEVHRTYGYTAMVIPYRLRHDGWTGMLLLICLLLAAELLLRIRGKFSELLRTIFLPTPKEIPANDILLRKSTQFIAVVLLSLTATIVTFVCTQHDAEYFPFPETPYILLLAFLTAWLIYFIVKRLTLGFVFWIFFTHEKIITWSRVYSFILILEALLSFPVALIAIFLPILPDTMMLIVSLSIILVKILSFYEIWKIFLSYLHGVLHLIIYFCSLELAPLLILLQSLASSDWLKAVKI